MTVYCASMRTTWVPAKAAGEVGDDGVYFICGNANSTPLLAVFGHRCMTALCRV
jgi:hypothetical protein